MLAKLSTLTVSHFENGKNNLRLSSIINILGVLGMNDYRYIEFSTLHPKSDDSRMIISFIGYDKNKKEITFAISYEAIQDHFHNTLPPVKAFIENKERVYHEARKKYLANQFEKDGTILIGTNDL